VKYLVSIGSVVLGVIVFALSGVLIFWTGGVNHVENYQMGYKFDRRNGEITVLPRVGYFITPPILVKVHVIDLRPMQVCISSSQRVLNCKLVQFNPEGLLTFIAWHGRGDYEGPGTSGSPQGSANAFADILEAYAYEGAGRGYSFLTVLRELKTADLEVTAAAPSSLLAPPPEPTPFIPAWQLPAPDATQSQ